MEATGKDESRCKGAPRLVKDPGSVPDQFQGGNVKRWTLMIAAGAVVAGLLGGCIVVPGGPGYYGGGGGGYYHHPRYDYYR